MDGAAALRPADPLSTRATPGMVRVTSATTSVTPSGAASVRVLDRIAAETVSRQADEGGNAQCAASESAIG